MENSDAIISRIRESRQSQKFLNPDFYFGAALDLEISEGGLAREHEELERLRQEVAKKKLGILKEQEKRNVAAAEIETEADDAHRQFKLQEHKVERIDEIILLCKAQGKASER